MKTLFFIFTILFILILPEAKAFAQSTPSPGTSPDVPSLGANNSTPGTTTTPNASDLGATVTTTNGNSSCTETAECLQARQRMQTTVGKIKPLSMEIGMDPQNKYWRQYRVGNPIDMVRRRWRDLSLYAEATLCSPALAIIIVGLEEVSGCYLSSAVDKTKELVTKAGRVIDGDLFALLSNSSDQQVKDAATRIADRGKLNDPQFYPTKAGLEKLAELSDAVASLQTDTAYYDQNCQGCFPGAEVPRYNENLPPQHFDNYTDFRNHISSVINIAALSADTHTSDVEAFKEPWWQDLLKYLNQIIFKIIEFIIGFVTQLIGNAAGGS